MNDRTRVSRSRLAALAVTGLLVLAPAAAMAQDATGSPAPATTPVEPRTSRPVPSRAAATARRSATSRSVSIIPFAKLVSNGIKEQAEIAGADLVFCDAQAARRPRRSRARSSSRSRASRACINFQVDQAQSPEFCEAYDNVPTIAIDIVQPPCEVAFLGANNHEAGRLAGAAIGKYAKETWDCDYDGVRVARVDRRRRRQRRPAWAATVMASRSTARSSTRRSSPDADRTDKALDGWPSSCRRCRATASSSSAINEDGILGAIGAAATLGRDGRPLLRRPGRRPVDLEGRRLQPAVHRLRGLLPRGLRQDPHPRDDRHPGRQGDRADARRPFVEHVTTIDHQDNIREIYPATPGLLGR